MKGRQRQQHLRSGQRRHMSFDMFRHISSSLLIMLATWWLSIFWIANRFTQRTMVAYVLRFTDNASSTQSKLSSPKWMLFDQIHRDQFCPSTVSQRIFKKIKLPWSSRTSLHRGILRGATSLHQLVKWCEMEFPAQNVSNSSLCEFWVSGNRLNRCSTGEASELCNAWHHAQKYVNNFFTICIIMLCILQISGRNMTWHVHLHFNIPKAPKRRQVNATVSRSKARRCPFRNSVVGHLESFDGNLVLRIKKLVLEWQHAEQLRLICDAESFWIETSIKICQNMSKYVKICWQIFLK